MVSNNSFLVLILSVKLMFVFSLRKTVRFILRQQGLFCEMSNDSFNLIWVKIWPINVMSVVAAF